MVARVGEGKGREAIDKCFDTRLTTYQKDQIAAGRCGMSAPYIGAITTHCPKGTVMIDCFHIVKALNKAIDKVRMRQRREADTDQRDALKGL